MHRQQQQQPGARQHAGNRDALIHIALDTLDGTSEWHFVSTLYVVLSALGCLYWLYALDMAIERKGFTLACYLWMASSTASLSTIRRDRAEAEKRASRIGGTPRRTTDAAYYMALASVIVSILLSAGGWYVMPLSFQIKGYLGMSALLLVGAVFTHAKTVRDSADAVQWRMEIFGGGGDGGEREGKQA